MAKIDELFKGMKPLKASDLLLSAGYPPVYRVKGKMCRANHPALTNEGLGEMFQEILTREQQEYLKKNRDMNFAYELPGVGRFRCNIFFQHRGISAVFHIHPVEIPTIEELKLPEVVYKIAEFRKGLVLITGPSGCGKSTTLAAIVNHINNHRTAHILTIEDPIEFVHPGIRCIITQREVGPHAHSFADALRVAAREDPDVIVVSEMRDPETIELALTCASQGMLVLSTLHPNSATKSINYLVESFPPDQQSQIRSLLGDSLRAIIVQQLLNTRDGSGQCAANEILLEAPTLGNMIREGKISQIPSLMQSGSAEGMQSMDVSLMKLIKEEEITPEAAYEKAVDKNIFLNLIKERRTEPTN